jgi:hypothetical protein
VRSEILTVFWVITPYEVVYKYQHVAGSCYLHLQPGQDSQGRMTLKMQAAELSEQGYLQAILHGILPQKAELSVVSFIPRL